MRQAYALAARYDPEVLCEEFIAGDETTCPVLGAGAAAQALPLIRIVAPDGNYDYQNKYFTRHHPNTTAPAACRRRKGGHPAHGRKSLPHPGLPGLGARRCDDSRQRPQAVLAGNQHLAGHDGPLPGAHGRPARGISYEALCLQLLATATLDSAAATS